MQLIFTVTSIWVTRISWISKIFFIPKQQWGKKQTQEPITVKHSLSGKIISKK